MPRRKRRSSPASDHRSEAESERHENRRQRELKAPSKPPNQALHLTGAAILVSRDTKPLQRPRQVSFSLGPPIDFRFALK